MQAVLYTQRLEPITVVDIPHFLWLRLKKGEVIGLAVPEKFDWTADYREPPKIDPIPAVRIFAEILVRHGHEHMMLFTDNEEFALQLRADFLPGQRGEVADIKRQARAEGFLRAFQMLS